MKYRKKNVLCKKNHKVSHSLPSGDFTTKSDLLISQSPSYNTDFARVYLTCFNRGSVLCICLTPAESMPTDMDGDVSLEEFFSVQKDKLKNIYNKQTEELFSNFAA